ncbi:MAG: hypothetical protein KAQ98_09095 [Bacteriovoracaceae bacterium]|nr:hypothetical protein [Bacteriovoracaceae bacterium]
MFRIIFLFLILIPPSIGYGTNYAIIMGGAGQYEQNEFLDVMSNLSKIMVSKKWETHVLYDSDKYLADWQNFPKKSRPTQKRDSKYHFTLKNYERILEKIGQNADSSDQVFIQFSAHGTNIIGHSSVWGGGYPDGVMDVTLKTIWNEITHSHRTKKIFDKIESLLKNGVPVYVDTISCYDGRILNDINSLLNRYPELLCVTTATTGNRPAGDDSFLLESLETKTSPASILERIKNSSNPSTNISFLKGWIKSQEKLDSKLNMNSDPQGTSIRTGVPPEALCAYANLDTHTANFLRDQIKRLFKYSDDQILKQVKLYKNLENLCSDEYNSFLAMEFQIILNNLSQKLLPGGINISQHEIPELFSEPMSLSGIEDKKSWLMCGTNNRKGIRISGDAPVSCNINLFEIHEVLYPTIKYKDEKNIKARNKLKEYLKNNKFEPVYKQFFKKLAVLEKQLQDKSCSEKLLSDIRIKLRNKFIEKSMIKAREIPKSIKARKVKACSRFKI